MISFNAMTLRVIAIVSGCLVLLVAHINVEAQQQMSDNDVYQVDDVGYYNSRHLGNQDQGELYYPARPSLPEEYSQGLAESERAKSSDDYQEQYLRLLQELHPEMDMSPMEMKKDADNLMLAHDLSSHWPATGIDGQEQEGPLLSRPVNDPEEFEAKLGQLTDALNNNMPNTRMRQQLLLGLINETRQVPDAEADELPSLLSQMVRSTANSDEDASSSADLEASESSSVGGYLTGASGSEYIDRPLELTGHQYVQGGAGEGRQLLGPEGTFENVQVVKTDAAVPSYCDPPNPCPIGYTAKDGCLEEFVNLASFSREYQAKQKCSCDSEHSLFNCGSPTTTTDEQHPNSLESRDVSGHDNEEKDEDEEDSRPSYSTVSDKLDTLARTIQNRFGDLASVQRLIGKQQKMNEKQQQQQQEAIRLAGNDDENSDYLVRSARKLSSLDMHHKVDLD